MAAVLIIDRPSAERDKLLELLVAAGHRVSVSSEAADGLIKWRLSAHELAIVDEVALGSDLVTRLKNEPPHPFVPILVVAQRQGAEARAAALQGADDAVSRPYDPSEVAARVATLLRMRRTIEELRQARAESEARAVVDAATGLRNRVFLGERLGEEWKRATRYNEPLSLILISIDGLKQLAEARGVAFADRVMRAVASSVQRSLRQIDVVTRFGVGELAALLPNTHFAGSLTCAERIAGEVGRADVEDYTSIVSMGIAFYPSREVQEPADLLKFGVRALDRAREEGPGTVCLFQHQGYLFQPKRS